MFKNQYDTDVTTWSPQGRVFQIEYAMEAVKQGSAVVGLRTRDAVALGAVLRSPHKSLAGYLEKLFLVDSNMAVGMSGLTADGRVVVEYMREEALNHRYLYDAPLGVGELCRQIGEIAQVNTQKSSRRPFGVGLLVAGCDPVDGPVLMETCPTGNVYEYTGFAIGGRAQSAKTYLERVAPGMQDSTSTEDLKKHLVSAVAASAPPDVTLKGENVQIAVVTKDGAVLLDVAEVQLLLDANNAAAAGEGNMVE